MKDYFNEVNDRFPVRNSPEQKEEFCSYVKQEAEANGWAATIDCPEGKHRNLVLGDPQTADVIFTAHYDTPMWSLFPNLLFPRCKPLSLLYVFSYCFLMAAAALGITAAIALPLQLGDAEIIAIYLVLYLGLFTLLTRSIPNKNNKNDNTSGVAVLLQLMTQNSGRSVAFVFFDNEEKGLQGSREFAKRYPEIKQKSLILNLDCVAVGREMAFVIKPSADRHPLGKALRESLGSLQNDRYRVQLFPIRGSASNSDFKNFDCGIGVFACRRVKHLLYTSRIHTHKDTVGDFENILFLADTLTAFVQKEVR